MNGKDIDAKIDELAQMVARGFSEVHKEIGELREEVEDTKMELREEIENVKVELTGQIQALDKHLIVFRKDYDELTARVKDLELVA